MTQNDESYLGDGLYAQFDGYHIRLRAPRTEGDHVVYLDPYVLESFMTWLQSNQSNIERARQ